MAVTSREKRGRLESAYRSRGDSLPDTAPILRNTLFASEENARALVADGSVASTSGNGHSVQWASYGPGNITQYEIVDLYRALIDDFDTAYLFLSNCALYGLDPFTSEFQIFPTTLSAVSNPVNRVLIDSTGRFANLCFQFGIDSTKVVGQSINDHSIFCWLMYHCASCVEMRSDYTQLRTSEGAQFA